MNDSKGLMDYLKKLKIKNINPYSHIPDHYAMCIQLKHNVIRKPHRWAWIDAEILYCRDCKMELGTISETESRQKKING